MTRHASASQGIARLLTVREVSERTRLSERHVRRMIADGRLASVRLRGLRAVRVRETDLLALIA